MTRLPVAKKTSTDGRIAMSSPFRLIVNFAEAEPWGVAFEGTCRPVLRRRALKDPTMCVAYPDGLLFGRGFDSRHLHLVRSRKSPGAQLFLLSLKVQRTMLNRWKT